MLRKRSIYLASRWSRRDELLEYASELEVRGHSITSRWIKGHDKPEDEWDKARYAAEDLDDILSACTLIFFSLREGEDRPRRNGRLVELGFAFGKGLDIISIGPMETIFHFLHLTHHQLSVVESWQEALELI